MRTLSNPATGETIREAIYAKGMTQRWLARKLGVSEAVMASIIDGRRRVSPSEIATIASLLDLDPTVLV